MMQTTDVESIKIKLASPQDILSWSHGEVTKPETINYRNQKAEKDGLFCEKIFGPEKDYECYCGKYKGIRYKGVICDRCGVEITKSSVRRERMGHIKLVCPVAHIWFLRGVPSRMAMILDVSARKLEDVIYFSAYIVTKVNKQIKKNVLQEIEKEYKEKIKDKNQEEIEELKQIKQRVKEEVLNIEPLKIFSEVEYRDFSLKYGEIFEAGTGAETVKKIFEKIDLKKLSEKIKKELKEISLKRSNGAEEKRLLKRLIMIEGMIKNNLRPEWMFFTVLPVIPPDLRPMIQLEKSYHYASSDLNDLYRRVINRNNRLKRLFEIDAPGVIIRNEKRMLQEAVDALIDNQMRRTQITTAATTGGKRALKSLADTLRGKQGRFRQNLLGKRVDYSGRSVIVIGPELKLHQCGIPKHMALELFKPFIIEQILSKKLASNPKAAIRLIEQETDDVWEILEHITKNKLVLLNRAPTLHRLGIQAFYPVLIEGKAIQIHPLVCEAFNADFDGDQMAVHLLLSDEAEKEAKDIILSSKNFFKPATGEVIVNFTLDIVLGCYFLTTIKQKVKAKKEEKIFSSFEEAYLSYKIGETDLREPIKVQISQKTDKISQNQSRSRFLETSVGRIIFNQNLPPNHSFVNETINSSKLRKIANSIIEEYEVTDFLLFLDRIKNLGFEFSTQSGISWGIDDLIIPLEKKHIIKQSEEKVTIIEDHYQKGLLTKEEKDAQIIEIWHVAKSQIEELMQKVLPSDGSALSMVKSGAKGSLNQLTQMSGMKGLVMDPAGKIVVLPIRNSYKEGLDILEYFISTHGSRKGLADTALKTSVAGYLTRRLVDVAHEVIIFEKDCKDKNGIIISKKESEDINQNFIFKITGRMVLEDIKIGKKILIKKGEFINRKQAREITEKLPQDQEIRIRSPISCQTIKGICQNCYGWDLGSNTLVKLGTAVGVIAAQSIGEPGTQLTMRTFHTGGIAGEADITVGLPRIEEIFEVRSPAVKSIISHVDGKIIEIKEEKSGIKLIKIRIKNKKTDKGRENQKLEIVKYEIPSYIGILVKENTIVKKGQRLSDGNIDLRELVKVIGVKATQQYIVKEIQKIYISQGVTLHDKHIEIIVRQMFSRLQIQDPGESNFIKGELIDKETFVKENEFLKKKNKKLIIAQPLLLGITKVALTCNSFLSATSFQETSRILTKAAIEGKEDKLQGLKENVIIGKIIPVGTGFKKISQ